MRKIKVRKISKSQKIILIIFACILCLPIAFTLGRFVYQKAVDLYFTSKNFFFESDKLTVDNASYLLDYWNGVDPYDVVINLNSFKNNKLKSNNDITYKVSYTCSSTVICNTTKEEGTIYKDTNTDSFTVTMTPNATFKDGDSVVISIEAESTSPYKKKLSAQFKLVVGKYGLSHEITDNKNDVYLELKVTNTLDYYTIKEAFDNYDVNDRISSSDYAKLSDENKAKCASAIITVSFDPNVIYTDNNNTTFLNSYNIETEKLNGFDYINKFTFKMDSASSTVVKFYKKDAGKDYTDQDVVKVSYEF